MINFESSFAGSSHTDSVAESGKTENSSENSNIVSATESSELKNDTKNSDISFAVESDKTENVDSTLSALQDCINKNNCKVGIAFLGYIYNDSTEKDLQFFLKNSIYAEKYPFLCKFSDVGLVAYDGEEFYALVPKNSKCSITVYQSDISENSEYKNNIVYRGKPGEVILLRCNISKIYSNVLISVTDDTGNFDFHPMLSMMDGHIAIEEGCYDFSIYDNNNVQDTKIAYELLSEADEVKDALNKGMKLLYTGDKQYINGKPCMIFALGTDHNNQFVRENLYAVSDNVIYFYDTITDSWGLLGAG